MSYWAPVKKQAPFRTITGLITSGGFSYYMGPYPTRFRALPDGCGHLCGRVCRNGLTNYWAPVKKQAPLRTIAGFLSPGNFSYYMGPSATRFRALPDGVWAFIWAGLSKWVNEFLGAGGKAFLLENANLVDNVWKYQLFHGSISYKVSGVTGGLWAFNWAGLSQWVNELLGAGEKECSIKNDKWVANVWKYQLLHGAASYKVSGVTGALLAFIWAGLSQWVNGLLDAGEKAGHLENDNWVTNFWQFQLSYGSVAY